MVKFHIGGAGFHLVVKVSYRGSRVSFSGQGFI